ncbi:MAG: peptidoglycan editing factor PgeF [Acidiferrobacterales bacterium]|nr:peptidoglycan editing factor PgeF [Acidiferrobacterales bacterium]
MKVPHITAPCLARLEGISHGFFGRQGGVSESLFDSLNCSPFSGDDLDHINENRKRICSTLDAATLITNKQVHGADVRLINQTTCSSEVYEADGLVTREPGLALGALGADCAPVLFADPVSGVVGAAHAGWQGAVAGITDSVVRKMCEVGAKTNSITATIGPAIQKQSYEVGDQFRQNLLARSPIEATDCFHRNEYTANIHFDLPGYIVLRLKAAGLGRIFFLSDDTYSDDSRYFSYRRACHNQEANYGRQVGAICIKRPD